MQPFTPRPDPKYPMPISADAVRTVFDGAADLVTRQIVVGSHTLTAFSIDGLVSGADTSDFVMRPLSEALRPAPPAELLRQAKDGAVYNSVADPCPDMDTVCRKLVNGFCVVIFPDVTEAVAYEVKTGEKRSPAPPDVENTVKGAKDAFTETSRTNTSLVRRHLRTPELRLWETVVGRKSLTNVSLLYIEGLTDPALVARMKHRLDEIDVDGLTSPASVEEYLTGSRKTAFPLLQYTQRADRFAEGLLAGQLGVLVDGLPLGYLAPVNLGRLMTAAEDRGTDYVSASCIRLVRYLALLASLLLPALYVAMVRFYPAMIPTKLLTAIIDSKQDVPFPIWAEVLGLLISFELLQEAGLHLPQSVGHTVSIIGGLVVGTAAVEAKIISPAALIVVSVAGICGFAVPGQDFSDAVRVWRFALTVAASLAGLFGLTAAVLVLLLHLGGLGSFGAAYLAPFSSAAGASALVRPQLVADKFRDAGLHPRDQRNQR